MTTKSSIRTAIINLLDALKDRLTSASIEEYAPKTDAAYDWALMDGLFNISADAIIIFDHNQRIARFNKGAEYVFGYTQAEAIGEPIGILLPPRFGKSHRIDMDTFAAGLTNARLMGDRREISGR
ncbi:MAG: PAS domain S-box protein, partial [Chloroflexi bacterium]|nr:PAS domain S-box protein [Chloroflexota bacterium]